jgi:L-ascorbate metabolism protein UlaG (beta-lactamase superfamily)
VRTLFTLLTRRGLFCLAAAFCTSTTAHAAGSDLRRYGSFVVSAALQSSPPTRGVRVTYLGTNGYLLEAPDATILIDPYFSRISLPMIAFNSSVKPHIGRINSGMTRVPKRVDAILVTHGHFDHLLDVPEIARRTGANIIASPTSCYLAQASGTPALKTSPVLPGDSLRCGNARVQVLAAVHDQILGVMPFPGTRGAVPSRPPRRPSDWVCGEPLAFLIDSGGKRIYVDAGGTLAALPPAVAKPVDLAILGVYLRESRSRVLPALQRLRPRYILPSHQDDFFRPLSEEFQFGPMTDFSDVLRSIEKYRSHSSRPAHLILLDYFVPWVLK